VSVVVICFRNFIKVDHSQIKLLHKLTENPAEFIGIVTSKTASGLSIIIRGHILDMSEIDDLPPQFIGKKLYLTNLKKDFPSNLSTDENKGVFIGKCIAKNKILLSAIYH
jgi:hypothetical protein